MPKALVDELVPPAFLQLAGHPVRWRLLHELGRSDRTVQELTGLLGQPQNLVSYHLARLREARLVAGRRSSADRRDTYYTADLTRIGRLLGDTGAALHPGLRAGPHPSAPVAATGGADTGADANPEPDPEPDGSAPQARVLFLCTGNSARSQMAEALAKVRSGGRVDATSAGSHPKPLHPLAVRAMREVHGIDIAGHRPKPIDEVADQRFDRVVSLCDRVREVCPELPGQPEATHWSIPDPSATGLDGEDAYPTFRQLAVDLATRVDFLLAALAASPAEAPPAAATPTSITDEEKP
ncbi:MAG TPA: MarR family transcriptional regulator [Acidimicrobiales bacterium]